MKMADQPDKQKRTAFLKALLREPLVHFVLIGAVVFAAFELGSTAPTTAPNVIEIAPERIDRIEGQFEATWRRPPTEEELDRLIEGFVREEVYYREALALGLDRDDTVIRRRLEQKMEFIGDAAAESMDADDATLKTFLEENPERFESAAKVGFEQVSLGKEDPGAALARLKAGADPTRLGRGGLLPGHVEASVRTTVDGTFGTGFFDDVTRLAAGRWQGPVASTFGTHLVRVNSYQPAATPALEDVREEVELDWRRDQAERLREAQYQALRERYEVIVPGQETAE